MAVMWSVSTQLCHVVCYSLRVATDHIYISKHLLFLKIIITKSDGDPKWFMGHSLITHVVEHSILRVYHNLFIQSTVGIVSSFVNDVKKQNTYFDAHTYVFWLFIFSIM